MDLRKRIKEIEAELAEKFPEIKRFEKIVETKKFPVSAATSKKLNKKKITAVQSFKQVTFKSKTVAADGSMMKKIIRFTIDRNGNVVKKTFSR